MKKIIWIALVVSLCLSLFGCSGNSTATPSTTSASETYLSMAEDFIGKGDYESAINVLQKGYDTTGDESLSKAMQETIAAQVKNGTSDSSSVKEFDYHDYLGVWATTDLSYEQGGYILDFQENPLPEANDTSISISRYSGHELLYEANIFKEFAEGEITSNIVEFRYDDDNWGNYGDIKLEFKDKKIYLNVINPSQSTGEPFKFADYAIKDCEMIWFPDAYNFVDALSYWNDGMIGSGDEDIGSSDSYVEPTHDASTASGILASLGMTEQEFRDNCEPLDVLMLYKSDITKIRDIADYPTNYVGHYYVTTSLSDFRPITVQEKASENGQVIYGAFADDSPRGEYVLLVDYRDDVYSPTISKGDKIIPYMIYEGIKTIDGTDWLVFDMISCDKFS